MFPFENRLKKYFSLSRKVPDVLANKLGRSENPPGFINLATCRMNPLKPYLKGVIKIKNTHLCVNRDVYSGECLELHINCFLLSSPLSGKSYRITSFPENRGEGEALGRKFESEGFYVLHGGCEILDDPLTFVFYNPEINRVVPYMSNNCQPGYVPVLNSNSQFCLEGPVLMRISTVANFSLD